MKKQEENEKAPLFGNWTAWYVLVIAFLGLLILLFYIQE